MSKTVKQIYDANPIASMVSTDLMYVSRSPYGLTNNAAVAYSVLAADIAAVATALSVLLDPSADQVIVDHNLTLLTGIVQSGSAAGGVAGSFKAFATTTNLGSLSLTCANNGGNYANVLTNASTSAARTWTLPDASGTIALANTTGGLTPVSVSGTTQALASGSAYIFNNAAATTGTLPPSPTIGDLIKVKGRSSAPWIIQANTGQIITNGATQSTTAGTCTSALGTDSIQLMYVAANEWSIDWSNSSGIVLA